MSTHQPLDLIGVGIGPFNLSIAALSATKPQLSSLFFEKKEKFAWHPGLLLKDSKMQTSFLKDLVTGVDPTSPYSFLNYLVNQHKLHPFMASGQSVISRLEFSDYMAWAAHQMPNTRFNSAVESIRYQDGLFVVTSQGQQYRSQHLVMGTGIQPYVPKCAESFLSATCFHASQLALHKPDLTGKRVAIIGGGQTGADVFQHVFDKSFGTPEQISWISRRPNIESLDEGCFTDEYFMPDYVNGFYHLDQNHKDREVSRQKLTSDGITTDCLQGIYQRLYHDKYVLKNPQWWTIQPHRTLVEMDMNQSIASASNNSGYRLQLTHGLTGESSLVEADVVILCTGFKRALPRCLASLLPQIETDASGQAILSEDFCANWQGSDNNRIYMVNAGTRSHGIAEPQLSLAAWRAAKIINHICGEQVYDISEDNHILDWGMMDKAMHQADSGRMSAIA
ncbi:SidA/IucD/PvdA family monooxygenase [Paraneptunicella aestuarii]|uniref:lysine N(6)-hydroxylase/L-ornithine N(5)-oxygenase family protein n=1 Tax=Paraneptunicella aestuarii TaxID=2831148 RepID=UPI001E2FA760|nr:SidA/IucD/PvdA family monooxygenase [Paraneptunicella aestuarii]UAA37371.1 SidA/IucD/PvdA family monooxygenase [Paraneptunicella aestuarii]